MFKSWGLTQDQAQQAVDFYVEKSKEAVQAPFDFYQETRKGWQSEVKADPNLGGKLDVVRSTISRALDALGDPGLKASFQEAMDITGAGDHPAFVRTLYAMAQRLTEGTQHVQGLRPSPLGQNQRQRNVNEVSAAEALYPHLPSNQRG